MVLLVPDGPEEVAEESAETHMDPSGQPKAQLDDSEASRATQKVDLDLDDAPFLEDEEEEEVELEEAPEEEAPSEEKKEKKELPAIFKNKLFYMAVVIAVLLIVILYLLFSRPDAPPPPPPPEPEPIEEPLVEPEPVITGEILLRLDPFLIEQKDEKGAIRFLEVRLVLNTTDEELARQFKQETFTVRNALYYYLKNKDLQFLSDKNNADKLKQELLAVVNQYMGFGQFETLLFEQYLVR
ncbi:flagellar basal body-associated FliL family protein [Salidesulfovibrio onnuriiensis]|uniref:flagellar basal body-associated FliL family protein n=1 Tax=Salidesulfovibrio onnuriiensis TaxID=2583823 RepID=UPI0011CAA422|nr:flagellar basal body-associated FliL family protein [Salidesulfovibrio onnuriiensis]